LADFDGLSISEAIGKLAQACNHLALFNVYGDFFFIPRDTSDSEDYIIEHTGSNSVVTSGVKKDRGYSEIYNHITITPSITQVSEVEWELIMVKREEGEENVDFKEFVELNSLNNLKRKLRMVCTEGGTTGTDVPLFKFLIEYDNIDVRIGQSLQTTHRSFLLTSTFGGDQLDSGVHSGDFLQITDENDSVVIREILGGRGYANIESTVSSEIIAVQDTSFYRIGDRITLYNYSNGDRFSSTITSISAGVSITLQDLPTGTYGSGNDALAPIKGSPAIITLAQQVGLIVPKNSEAVAIRVSAADGSGTWKSWSSDSITFTTGSGIDSETVPVNNVDFITAGCWIRIGEEEFAEVTAINVLNKEIAVDPVVTFSEGDSIGVYWAPELDGWVEIPQSGFELKLSYAAFFKQGDVFTISTDGLVLKDDSKSRKIAVSISSKDKHGKLDYPTIKNRFINPVLGEVLSREVLSFYKWPHYHLKLSMYYLPLVDFVRINRLASFKIISQELFPYSRDFARNFYLRSMTIDVKKNVVGLELVDKDAY
jgi:hypothetical protein